MADRNTTQKDTQTGKLIEKGQPRCKRCFSRLSVVEVSGESKLWCFTCDSPFLNRK